MSWQGLPGMGGQSVAPLSFRDFSSISFLMHSEGKGQKSKEIKSRGREGIMVCQQLRSKCASTTKVR